MGFNKGRCSEKGAIKVASDKHLSWTASTMKVNKKNQQNMHKEKYNPWSAKTFHWRHLWKNIIHTVHHSGYLTRLSLVSSLIFSLLFVFTHAFHWGHFYKQIWYFFSTIFQRCSYQGFGLMGGGGGVQMFFWCRGGDHPILCFAVTRLCVEAVVTVHFNLDCVWLENLLSIFFLQR